jgi:hypothetical protein
VDFHGLRNGTHRGARSARAHPPERACLFCNRRNHIVSVARKLLLAAAIGGVLSAMVAGGAQAGEASAASPRYQPEMVAALAD